ncbi:MAG TPA: DEAD/DEAH box helicase [Methylomusa anaerophila]|uniref:DNA 3'-5' helicase n=1 Tax=Methylomusa anaerophila TaxID=1930071 RepID=A0A348AH01_9FIRM|nr:DNA repair helicase XPB [Methylomusa anaerophila]BBB90349.1 type III restriction enzyme, res subunit [Methylomusa anaerophila]HML89305.1 DEAD/DEAH box helicase [Methylomusa anaerophila]
MQYRADNPLIVQGDFSVLLEAYHPKFETVRAELAQFADLEKSPEHIHSYRITPLSLWNAAAIGLKAGQVIAFLDEYVKFPLPDNVRRDIASYMGRYGLVKLLAAPPELSAAGKGRSFVPGDYLYLYSHDLPTITAIAGHKETKHLFASRFNDYTLLVAAGRRGMVKQALVKVGFPVEDLAGYIDGEPLHIRLAGTTSAGRPFALRDYQRQAADIFYANGRETGGSGVLVLPCGAGKTIIGLGIMSLINMNTLILTTSTTAVRQWVREILDKTGLTEDQVGEYSSETKNILPVTVATYQMITYRPSSDGPFPHFELFNARSWGLIIYDEVHTLPAPVFQVTAELQTMRRLGLTATLVREDKRETDVFTLIGPKKLDIPWRELEAAGWIAEAVCTEVRVPLNFALRMECAQSPEKTAYRLEAENPAKLRAIEDILARHPAEGVLIIGQYIRQLETIAAHLNAPLITGKTKNAKRDELYERFRQSQIPVLVVSKVANFAIDLPDAGVAIQVSGAFGSRQEEAQRLGRILRPKANGRGAYFYSVVSKDTREQEFAHHRQLFLAEQGYRYEIIDLS